MSEEESEEEQEGKSYTKSNQTYEQQFKGKNRKVRQLVCKRKLLG